MFAAFLSRLFMCDWSGRWTVEADDDPLASTEPVTATDFAPAVARLVALHHQGPHPTTQPAFPRILPPGDDDEDD